MQLIAAIYTLKKIAVICVFKITATLSDKINVYLNTINLNRPNYSKRIYIIPCLSKLLTFFLKDVGINGGNGGGGIIELMTGGIGGGGRQKDN